jgi:hypothetical protein
MENPVTCRSDYAYAQRPTTFLWEAGQVDIALVLAEWRTPEGKGFRVQSAHGQVFELFYNQHIDQWRIQAF